MACGGEKAFEIHFTVHLKKKNNLLLAHPSLIVRLFFLMMLLTTVCDTIKLSMRTHTHLSVQLTDKVFILNTYDASASTTFRTPSMAAAWKIARTGYLETWQLSGSSSIRGANK